MNQQTRWKPKNNNELKNTIRYIVHKGSNFNHQSVLVSCGHISTWDTSLITDMNELFANVTFGTNQIDLSGWDVSNVVTFKAMFRTATGTIPKISTWKTGNCVDFSEMFYNCDSFNGDISNWDTSNAGDMTHMFCNCVSFNGDLSRWNTSRVRTMEGMFRDCTSYNGSMKNWDVSSVKIFSTMFSKCSNLTSACQIENWNTSSATHMDTMFNYCEKLDIDLSRWNVSNVLTFAFYVPQM